MSLYFTHRVEKLTQAFDAQTYREITAFLALGAGLLALAISSLMAWCLPL